MKKIKQSETVEIMRSQIRLNPCNPKRHTDKQVDEQKKNLQHVGYLGGVTWNEFTGNLIDGHRRIKALDLINKYNGTPETDYPVKVEKVAFDEKREKEQMTFMALANTKADLGLVAKYLPDIDFNLAGIDEYDLSQIQSFIPSAPVEMETIDDFIAPTESSGNSGNIPCGKEDIKRKKEDVREKASEDFGNLTAYLTVSFANAEEKRVFCELAGISEDSMFIKGSQVLDMIE